MSETEGENKLVQFIIIGFVVLILLGGLGYFIKNMLTAEVKPQKKVVAVNIIAPPPPKVEEEPPPPEEIEEEEIPEPEDVPEPEPLPDISNEPPLGDLGLDADGTGAGDAFGLVGRKGGRGIVGANDGSGSWYSGIVQSDLLTHLSEDKKVLTKNYSIEIQIWYQGDGSVKRIKLLNSTGDSKLDSTIQKSLNNFKRFSEAPSTGRGDWVKVRLTSRA